MTGSESLTADDGEDLRISQTVDAVYAIARAISALHDSKCLVGSGVCPAMLTATGDELFKLLVTPPNQFQSVTDGYIVTINTFGDPPPDLTIYNAQVMGDGTVVNVKVSVMKIAYR